MNDPKPKTCPVCGEPMDSAEVSGCPQCLMRAAMQPTGHPAGESRQPAPSLESVAAAFPQLEILELIGQGGMGCVFKARQPKLNRLVALKLLPASLTERDAAFAGRFEREGQLLARLHHPNIVAVHDSGTAGEFFYLIMEYVDGVNLRQAMSARRFTPGQALAIVPHIYDALQFAHDEGVLHRDIKPENILLDAKGRVKLADFGIAKLLADHDTIAQNEAPAAAGLTQSGTALGTPSYMSPEQRDTPADVDHRADIYSLGVVFYELLTGELPQGSMVRPSEKSTADPRVDSIVQQALEKERDRRQHSASEVKTQVETLAAGKGAPPDAVGLARPPRFSRLAIIGAVWALLLLLASGIFIFLFTAHEVRADQPTPSLPAPVIWLMIAAMGIGFAAPLGTTILGWIAFVQIRRSQGRLRGEGLALFDGLLFPALAVVTLPVYFFFQKPTPVAPRHSANEVEQQASENSSWIRSRRSGQCVTVSHGDAVQFALYSPEHFGHSVGGGTGADDGSWHEQVNISLLRHGRAFAVSRSSSAPETIAINGYVSGLDFGRAFFLGADGSIEQVAYFPSEREAHDGSEMATQIEKMRTEGKKTLISPGNDTTPPAQASPPPQKTARPGNGSALGSAVAMIVKLGVLLGILYVVYYVRRRYGWKAALLLIAAALVLVGLLAITSARKESYTQPVLRTVNRAPAQSLTFGPVIERVLPFDRHFIDFQSGSVMRPDYEKFGVDGADWESWIQQTGADAMVEESPQPGFVPPAPNDHRFPRLVALTSDLPELRGDRESCVFVGEEIDDFDSVRPSDAVARLKVVTERDVYWGLANGTRPWWFRTRDGAKGVLQILGTSDKPRGLRIRYRLLESAAAADLPQSFDEPYWKRYVNRSFDPKTGQGVAVYFDYGARLDPDFKLAMLELLQLRNGVARVTPDAAKADPNLAAPWGEAVDGLQASLRTDREE